MVETTESTKLKFLEKISSRVNSIEEKISDIININKNQSETLSDIKNLFIQESDLLREEIEKEIEY